MILLLVALSAVAPPPCPPAQSISEIVTLIESLDDGALIDLVDVDGDGFDQLLVASFNGAITVGWVKAGCIVSPPLRVGPAKAKGLGV